MHYLVIIIVIIVTFSADIFLLTISLLYLEQIPLRNVVQYRDTSSQTFSKYQRK